jgi:hypothetical protein
MGLVLNDVNFDENDNVLECEDVLDDEPNLNTCGIDILLLI